MRARITDGGDASSLAAELLRVAAVAPAEARKVVAKGLLNIKADARRRIGRPTHAPAYPSSITYDLFTGAIGGEVGPDKTRRQGALGNLLEYGSVHNPPHPHMGPAGDAEKPRFERAMEDLAGGSL